MILLVEDHPELREGYQSILKVNGFASHAVADGTAALDALEEYKDLRLVVLDLSLPDVSGWDVLARIRGSDAHKELPVIVHTALLAQEDKAAKAGANALVQKDGCFDRLLESIRNHMID